ncbi:MAG: hypothetical protein ACPGTI_16815, partial [bacterium]
TICPTFSAVVIDDKIEATLLSTSRLASLLNEGHELYVVGRSTAALEVFKSPPLPPLLLQAPANIPSKQTKEICNFSFFISFTNCGILAG